MSRKRSALPVAAAALVLAALPASAHVTVHSSDATPGGDDAEIVFRVPNEESVPTTKVEIALPAAQPIAGVYALAKPGWTFAVTRTTLATPIETDDGSITTAVTGVTWTATGGGIPVGGYDDFTLAAGHLPDVTSITFKALQTSRDGEVTRWIETGTDAEHPAPVLTLGKPSTAPSATAAPTVTASPVVPQSAAGSEDGTARALGATGLGLGVVGALLGLAALVRSGRPTRA